MNNELTSEDIKNIVESVKSGIIKKEKEEKIRREEIINKKYEFKRNDN